MIGEIPWAFLPGEYHAHLIGGNAAAVVPDNETHPLGGCLFQLEDDVPARFREFHGVGHQVEQRLAQCLGVKAAQNILGRQNQLQISVGCLYQRRQQRRPEGRNPPAPEAAAAVQGPPPSHR